MVTVQLKNLGRRLAHYLRLAAGGETVLVIKEGRVVAELVPPRAGRSPMLADPKLAEALRNGWLTPPLTVDSRPPPRLPVMSTQELLEELDRAREDR